MKGRERNVKGWGVEAAESESQRHHPSPLALSTLVGPPPALLAAQRIDSEDVKGRERRNPRVVK